MKRFVIAFCLLLSLTGAPKAFGWGQMGHDIVAAIAEKHLTSKTKERLQAVLGNHSIVYYSSWLDNIQSSPYWNSSYYVTKTWHYANVDDGFTYQTMTKNEKGDVVTALTMLTDQLKNNYSTLTDSMRTEYTRMVIHLVGDMHCPMHAGHLTDLGGNREKVRWFGQSTNLHSVWDSRLIESAHKWSYTEWCIQLDRSTAQQRRKIAQGTLEDWFNQTVEASKKIYAYTAGTENPSLSYQYVFDFTPMVEEQLLTAGYRLAWVLNDIFGK